MVQLTSCVMPGIASTSTFASRMRVGWISQAPRSRWSQSIPLCDCWWLSLDKPGALTQAAFSFVPTPSRSTTFSGSSPPTSVTVTRLELLALPFEPLFIFVPVLMLPFPLMADAFAEPR
jgi:hypothetical protein